MADLGAQSQELAALQDSIDRASKASSDLFSKASEATGNTQRSLLKLGQVFDSVAKNEAELLKTTTKINDMLKKRADIQQKMADAKDDEKDVLKKQLDDQDDILAKQIKQSEVQERQIKAQKEFLGQLGQTKSQMGQLLSSQVAQMAVYLASTASIMSGLSGIEKAVKRVATISITEGSYFGMSGDYVKDLKDLGSAAVQYSSQATIAASAATALGHSQEEANDSFQRFSRISGAGFGDIGKRSVEMRNLTVAASQLSTVLGTSLGETTDYMIKSQTKFGKTGAQTADTLFALQNVTEQTNKEFGRTIVQGRDVTKVLFDLANESTSLAQDQKYLGQTIVGNMAQLQSQGFSYDQALKTSSDYIKKLTTQAPDWAKVFAGRNLVSSLGSSFQQISPALLESLEKAKPGISSRLKDIYSSSMDPYTLQQNLQAALQDTQTGMDAMQKGMLDTVKIHQEGAQQRLMALYHITDPLEAQATMKLLATKEKEFQFKTLTTAQAKEQYGLSEASFELLKKGGAEAQITAIVQDKATKEAAAGQKKQEANEAAANAKRLQNAIKVRDQLEADLKVKGGGSEADQKLLKSLNANIDEMRNPESVLAKNTKETWNKLGAYVTESGGWINALKTAMTSDLAKIAGGVITTVLMYRTGREQLNTLKEIRSILSFTSHGGGGAGHGGGGGGTSGGIMNAGMKGVLSKEAASAVKANAGKLVFKEIEKGGIKTAEKVAAKGALKTGSKLVGKNALKALPFVGNIADAAFALGDAFDIGKTFLSGKKVRGSQYARLAGDVGGAASAFTGIGALGGGAIGIAGDLSAAALEMKEAADDQKAAAMAEQQPAVMAYGANEINGMFGTGGAPVNTSGAGGPDLTGMPGAGTVTGGGGQPTTYYQKAQVVKGSQGSSIRIITDVPTGDALAYDNRLAGKSAYGP